MSNPKGAFCRSRELRTESEHTTSFCPSQRIIFFPLSIIGFFFAVIGQGSALLPTCRQQICNQGQIPTQAQISQKQNSRKGKERKEEKVITLFHHRSNPSSPSSLPSLPTTFLPTKLIHLKFGTSDIARSDGTNTHPTDLVADPVLSTRTQSVPPRTDKSSVANATISAHPICSKQPSCSTRGKKERLLDPS